MTTTYRARWGHERKRTLKGHPLRAARRQRAAERQAEEAKRPANDPRRKSVRLGRVKLAA
jgi:hypothetical protein